MKINDKIIFAMLFAAMTGICAGAFAQVYITDGAREQFAEILGTALSCSEGSTSGIAFGSSLINSVLNILPFLAALFLTPFVIFTLPLIPVFLILRGTAAGFAAAMVLEIYGMGGINHILFYLLPCSLLQIPACCILAALSFQAGLINGAKLLSRGKPHLSKKRNALQFNARQYSVYFFICTAIIFISCLLEAFLLQLNFLPS